MGTPTSSLRESTSTTTKLPEAVTSQEPSLWILSQVPWMPSEPDHSVSSSDQTTSSSDRPVPVTTGPRVTTPKVPNSSTPSSMLSARKPKAAIASRDSRSPTLSVVVPDPVWEPSSSPRSERSTQTDRWSPTPSCHPPRCPTPLLSHTTPPSPSISSLRTPTTSCALTTRPFTISASEPLGSPPQPTVILTISFLPPFPESPAASDSQVSSTPTSESSLSTSCHSQDSISSWLVSPTHLRRIPAVQSPHRPRAHPAD